MWDLTLQPAARACRRSLQPDLRSALASCSSSPSSGSSVDGGVETYMPERHQDPVLRRLGPGPRPAEGEGEHRLPREARGDRGQGRLRAERHPAVGPTGHRARPSWPRPWPARPASRYVFVDPGAFIQMFMGVGIMKVQAAVQQAAQAGPEARRRDRLLRRGRHASATGASVSGGFGKDDARRRPREALFTGTATAATTSRPALSRSCTTSPWPPSRRSTSDVPAPAAQRSIIAGMGMGGGGGMGTLQAILTEMSGLKKPRGFFNRRRARLPVHPAEGSRRSTASSRSWPRTCPTSLDAALLRPGPHRPHVPRRTTRTRRPAHDVRGLPRQGPHTLTDAEQMESLAADVAVRVRRHDQGHRERVADRGHPPRPRHHHVARRASRPSIFKMHGMPDGWTLPDLEQSRDRRSTRRATPSARTGCSRRDVIDIATIEKRGPVGGFVQLDPASRSASEWRTDWEIDVVVRAGLAGR